MKDFNKRVVIHAPATVANMVCGFDILGFALSAPYDEMEMQLLNEPVVRIINNDDYNLPTDPEKNVAGAALLAIMKQLDNRIGFEVVIKKNIKPGSGIGSSAASSAGAVVGANYLLGKPFSDSELVEFAMYGEQVASGVKHADNITPCILGGVSLIRSTDPLDIIPLSAPELYVTIVHPQIEVKTENARKILRHNVDLKAAIKQWGNVAGLVAGLLKEDYALIGRSLEDVIIEPVRSILIPGFDDIKQGCREAGALGGGISGSGPSVFMLSQTRETAVKVERIMCDVYDKLNIDYHTYVTTVNTDGVKVF
ncbi:MAG: homoserine kinase, partial [Bacteroidales bacterium]